MMKRLRLIALLASVGALLLLGYKLLPHKVLGITDRVLYGGNEFASLETEGTHFKLHGKNFTILSGAIHYFRVVPAYWEDRLLKLKAMGLNTVETYVDFVAECDTVFNKIVFHQIYALEPSRTVAEQV